MKNSKNNKGYALYILLPLCFFALWYLGCAFVNNVYTPAEMTSEQRFVIAWFGMAAAMVGFLVADCLRCQNN
jgi:TRAP-type mannitol/chloroaromatic compound transport system permease small subunit